jgi:hypothetical protein
MGTTQSSIIYVGIFFLFIILSGFWLSRSGKPYNTFIFTVHKLIGLGVGIFLIRIVYLTHQVAPLSGTQWTAIVLTVLLFILTVAAGGLLSVLAEGRLQNLGASMQRAIELAHKIFPYLIVLATMMTLYLLLFRYL